MFDTLPETRKQGRVLGRSAVSIAAFAHAALISGFLAAALFAQVDPGEDPPSPYVLDLRTLVVVVDPPPLGTVDAGSGKGGLSIPRPPEPPALPPEPPQQPPEPQQPPPSDIQDLAPPSEPSGPPPILIPREGETGKGNGDGGGTTEGSGGPGDRPGVYGDPHGRPGGTGPIGQPFDDEPEVIDGNGEPPVLLVRVQPEYPEVARHARVQGTVILQGVIGIDGRIESLRTIKSIPLLDRAAIAAVEQWRYKPSTQQGRAVKVAITIRVEFRLD